MLHTKTRRDALDEAIAELAETPPFAEIVGRLCCLRGVSTLTALALTVELGDWTRFRPQSLGPFLGLTPSDDSSGEKRRLGAITKTGNRHARRLLVESAWHHRRPPRPSVTLERRRRGHHTSGRTEDDRQPASRRSPLTSVCTIRILPRPRRDPWGFAMHKPGRPALGVRAPGGVLRLLASPKAIGRSPHPQVCEGG